MNSLKWKEYNDYIEICENGDVKSHGKFIKGEIMPIGYKRINTSHKGIHKRFLVHRLVAEAFIPNPNNYPCVNHIDGNKLNNSVSNLEWCTYGENLSHAFRIGLRNSDGMNNPNSKLTDEQVLQIRASYIKGKHCDNNSNGLAKKYNVSPRCILNIVNRKTYAALERGVDYTNDLYEQEQERDR